MACKADQTVLIISSAPHSDTPLAHSAVSTALHVSCGSQRPLRYPAAAAVTAAGGAVARGGDAMKSPGPDFRIVPRFRMRMRARSTPPEPKRWHARWIRQS